MPVLRPVRPVVAARVLAVLTWVTPVLGVVGLAVAGRSQERAAYGSVLLVVLGVVFAGLVARLAVAAVAQPERRAALGSLAAGVVSWAAGAAVLNASSTSGPATFPGPGEGFFLGAYFAFLVFVVLDGRGRPAPGAPVWLDAGIVVGGTACLAVCLLVTPFAASMGGRPVDVLVALLYPMLDVVLVLLVVGQVSLRRRSSGEAAWLVGGLAALASADSTLVLDALSRTYDFGVGLDLLWCVGFLLLVQGACRRTGWTPRTPQPGGVGTVPVLAAAAAALVSLLVEPAGALRLVVDVPAVLTLAAAGLRLVLALRAAQTVAEAVRLARTDDLTGLPNRRALAGRIETTPSGPLSLMLLDLDGFKEVNDSLGHGAGDATLVVIARRVAAAVSGPELAVRLGGDEFALLVHEDDPMVLLDRAVRLREAIRRPVRVDGIDLSLDVSVGIATRDDGVAAVGDLLRRADVAMYQAKQRGGGAQVYDSGSDAFTRERLQIGEDLRRGVEAGQIVVWYQPKVTATTGAVCGVEALVRWNHPVEGLLPPSAFLPAARRSGLMPALTRAVLDRVVRDVVSWRRQGLLVPVAVNVAPAELLAPSVMEDLLTHVRVQRLPPGSLVLEVTEDSFLAEPDRAREMILAVRAAGVEVSIDDYGTGFSSLAYLRDLPVQELKIDRSFVSGMADPRNRMIVRTAHELASGLGLRTVAEGVEDEDTARMLVHLGVDVLQGYHFSRPLPPAELRAWVRRNRAELTV